MKVWTIMQRLPRWSNVDKAKAHAEGWDVFDVGDGVLEVCRLDEAGIFASDYEAAQHVADCAAAGSALHMRALLELARAIAEAQALTLLPGDYPLAEQIEDAQARGDRVWEIACRMCHVQPQETAP